MVTTSKTLRSASIMAKFPVNSLLFPVLDGFQPRPDSSKLRHPPPSLANCGTARDRWVFPRGWRGFPGLGGTRDVPEELNGPHFGISSLISIFECHVCAKVGSGPLTGP